MNFNGFLVRLVKDKEIVWEYSVLSDKICYKSLYYVLKYGCKSLFCVGEIDVSAYYFDVKIEKCND